MTREFSVPTVPLSSIPLLADAARQQRQRIEHAIFEQRAIADMGELRDAVLAHLHPAAPPYALPVEAQLANRRRHLRPFAHLFRSMLGSSHPQMQAFTRNLQLARRLGWKSRVFRELPSTYDARFHSPDDLLIPFFQLVFQDRALLRQWLDALDAHVNASSHVNVLAMDRAACARKKPVRKDVVLVGGSALTAIVASHLGAYFRVTVLTPHGLGRPWRDRPIFLNSSSGVTDLTAPALPLLGGPTTRITGTQQLNSLEVDVLLGGDSLRVVCDDGSTREYVSGMRLGAGIATNILFHADDYIVGHTVDVSACTRTTDGSLRLRLVAEDGTPRELDASAVFLLTGPGPEQTAVPDPDTQRLYQATLRQVRATLQQDRQRTRWYREALNRLEADAALCPTQIQWLQARIKAHKPAPPRILTLSIIEEFYRYWLTEQHAEPALFPFTDLICQPKTVGYVGSGDTMRTMKELLEKRGPKEAYPPDLGEVQVVGTIYNESASSPAAYDAANRRRYQGVYTPTTSSFPGKVVAYRLVEDRDGNALGVEVEAKSLLGFERTTFYDSIVDATGLHRLPLETLLPDALAVRNILDLQGYVVARGNPAAELYIVGSATQFRAEDFPAALQRIIEILGIPVNTVSLWVHGTLADRAALSYVATHQPTKWKHSLS